MGVTVSEPWKKYFKQKKLLKRVAVVASDQWLPELIYRVWIWMGSIIRIISKVAIGYWLTISMQTNSKCRISIWKSTRGTRGIATSLTSLWQKIWSKTKTYCPKLSIGKTFFKNQEILCTLDAPWIIYSTFYWSNLVKILTTWWAISSFWSKIWLPKRLGKVVLNLSSGRFTSNFSRRFKLPLLIRQRWLWSTNVKRRWNCPCLAQSLASQDIAKRREISNFTKYRSIWSRACIKKTHLAPNANF